MSAPQGLEKGEKLLWKYEETRYFVSFLRSKIVLQLVWRPMVTWKVVMKVLLLSLGASNNIFINPFSLTVHNFCGWEKNSIIIGDVFTKMRKIL